MPTPPSPPLPSQGALPSPSKGKDKFKRIRTAKKIGYHHMAFIRGYLECLSLKTLTERYLEFSPEEERKAKKILAWVLEELIAAARRSSRHAMARVLLIAPERLLPSPADAEGADISIPTLEEFREEYDPSDFYTEKELIELFEEKFKDKQAGIGSHESQVKNRLRERQIRAINILESELVEIPRLSDPLLVWIDDAISMRIAKAGIYTLGDLVKTIQSKGRRWWVKVPRLGQRGAENIHKWLLLQQAHMGVDITDAINLSYKQRAKLSVVKRRSEFGLVPLEYLAIPEELSGYTGLNRGTRPTINARSDIEAIEAWLAHVGTSKHTIRNYRKEAERFWLWCLLERKKPLSSVLSEDCSNYVRFIDALTPPIYGTQRDSDTTAIPSSTSVTDNEAGSPPIPYLQTTDGWEWSQPREFWIGPKKPRWDKDWKPFAGPLSKISQKQAIVIVKALFEWLTRARYLSDNPWDTAVKTNKLQGRLKTEHALTSDQLKILLATCDEIENPLRKARMKFIVNLANSTGMRLFEMVGCKTGHIVPKDKKYWLYIHGKGGRERQVPLSGTMMTLLKEYMFMRGFVEEAAYLGPNANPVIPLIAIINEDKDAYERTYELMKSKNIPASPENLSRVAPNAIREKSVYELLLRLFEKASLRTSDLIDESRLRDATTHWLRHSFATRAIENGIEPGVVQELLGHADINTTMLYVKVGQKKKEDAVDLLERSLGIDD